MRPELAKKQAVPRLSIVVPLMGDQQRFEDTLVSVLENQPERSEVVVVTRGPYEDPYDLRREVGFVEAPLCAGLLECFAAGLGGSRAPLIHLLAAGVEATPGWADAALEPFNCGDVAAVAPLVVDRQQPQKVLSAGLRYTRSGSIKHLAAGRRLDRFKTAEALALRSGVGMLVLSARGIGEHRFTAQLSKRAGGCRRIGVGRDRRRLSLRAGARMPDDGLWRNVQPPRRLAGRRGRREAFPPLGNAS